MLRLGHIDFSNCFPVHARLLDRQPPAGIELRRGIPSVLNEELAAGRIDVAPCSSIEYALHAGRYRLVPDLVIGSAGAVRSILLEHRLPLHRLAGQVVAVPTASATSVVLLRILLERRYGVRPTYRWFDQAAGEDPLAQGAAAALRIGDVALRRTVQGAASLDLGEAWTEWTGLPFAFAVWQTPLGGAADGELRRLHGLLLESRAYYEANAEPLAARHAAGFGLEAAELLAYWRTLRYDLDAEMRQGLLHFYREAAAVGAAPLVTELRWTPTGG
jgi:chorismate dehydratase